MCRHSACVEATIKDDSPLGTRCQVKIRVAFRRSVLSSTAPDWICVDQDVAFTSLYALVRVETTSATTLGRLDRLAIHDHHRRTSCPSGITTGLLVEHAM